MFRGEKEEEEGKRSDEKKRQSTGNFCPDAPPSLRLTSTASSTQPRTFCCRHGGCRCRYTVWLLCRKGNRGSKSKKRSNNQPENAAGQRELAGKKMKSGAKPPKSATTKKTAAAKMKNAVKVRRKEATTNRNSRSQRCHGEVGLVFGGVVFSLVKIFARYLVVVACFLLVRRFSATIEYPTERTDND